MGPLPRLLKEREGTVAVKRIFAAEAVPLALVDDRNHRIPLRSLAALFERGARAAGDPRFGFDVGLHMPTEDYGLWMQYAFQADSLGDTISRVASTLAFHQSGSVMRIAPRTGGQCALEYWHANVKLPAFQQHSDGLVPGMISLAQFFLGPAWRPSRVEVGYPAPETRSYLEDATGTPWLFDQPALAIVFPSEALLARKPQASGLPPRRLLSLKDVETSANTAISVTPSGQIREVISLRLLDGLTDIEGAAALLDISCRTLQRLLDREGLNYRSLLNHVRMDRAYRLINETNAPIKRISSELGYGHPAHFTRAFSAQFGCPPSFFRTRNQTMCTARGTETAQRP
jgi:AraC-like DNA-binding protein